MISFGKYKDQSFEHVLEHDPKYCNWILTQTSKHTGINEFKQFLNNNRKTNIPKGNINCSDISQYYSLDNTFLNLINDLLIHTTDIGLLVDSTNELPPSIYGVYVDYYIRYKINCELKTVFTDARCELFLSRTYPIINNDILLSKLKIKYGTDIMDELSEIIVEIVENSYNNLQHFIGDNNDILNVSLCHLLCFREIIAYEYFDYIKDNNIKDNNIKDNNICDNNINKYIQMKLNNKQNVLCNPSLGNTKVMINADANLIIDKELIDIKCSKYFIGETIKDYIQLFIYISLYFMQTGIKCEKITILNPILGYEKYINLLEWDKFDEIINILKKRNK